MCFVVLQCGRVKWTITFFKTLEVTVFLKIFSKEFGSFKTLFLLSGLSLTVYKQMIVSFLVSSMYLFIQALNLRPQNFDVTRWRHYSHPYQAISSLSTLIKISINNKSRTTRDNMITSKAMSPMGQLYNVASTHGNNNMFIQLKFFTFSRLSALRLRTLKNNLLYLWYCCHWINSREGNNSR